MKKTRILIAGIGGVGGYVGGLLAKKFYNNNEVEIIFLARGKHLTEIQTNGLKVLKGTEEFVAVPTLATDNPNEIGLVDFIIVCTKSYDLETTIEQLHVCINNDTILLPLLNGVDSRERIMKLLPNNMILNGCVYIVARLIEAGKVEKIGNIETLFFGLDNIENENMRFLEQVCKQANINATLSNNMSSLLWEKFIFISPTATSTTYFDNSIGEMLADEEKQELIIQLIEEVKQIANAKKISISNDITQMTMNKLKSMPFEATSSMHADFKKKKQQTELQSLTGYVVNEGLKNNIPTPTYERLYKELEQTKKYDTPK